jgi:plastocyanin
MKNFLLSALSGMFFACLLTASQLAVNIPASGSLHVPATGYISGKVIFEGKAPALNAIDMSGFSDCAARHPGGAQSDALVLGDGNALANVLIRVKNPPANGASSTTSKPVVIDQNGCFFEPRVVAVKTGQPLGFKNSDGILHKVHGFPKVNKDFNIGMPPSVSGQQIAFEKPEGPFKVKCDVHPWAEAYVAVMTHPYFAVTGENGTFRIDGLPAGVYEVEAWHEKLGSQMMRVKVEGGNAQSSFSFKSPRK